MNAYLLNTAILSVGLEAPIISTAISAPVLEASYGHHNVLAEGLQTETSAEFSKGDFTAISGTTAQGPLYAGDGAIQMLSIRSFR